MASANEYAKSWHPSKRPNRSLLSLRSLGALRGDVNMDAWNKSVESYETFEALRCVYCTPEAYWFQKIDDSLKDYSPDCKYCASTGSTPIPMKDWNGK